MARNMTTGITRRGVVKGAAAAGLVLSTTGGARAQPLRQSVTAPDFRQATLDSYKRAIANMLALPPSDPRNWYRQAIIHVLDCPHDNWWFLPWHRGYILNFERICRQLSGDPDFALPYWDWTATPQLPDMFFDDVLNPAGASYMDFNSLQDAFRGPMTDFMAALSADQMKSASARGFATVDDLMADIGSTFVPVANARALTRQSPALPDFAQQAVAINVILDTLGLTRFEDFASSSAMFHLDRPGAGQLESQPHNNVHGGVSGMMGDFMSPSIRSFGCIMPILIACGAYGRAAAAASLDLTMHPGAQRNLFSSSTRPATRLRPTPWAPAIQAECSTSRDRAIMRSLRLRLRPPPWRPPLRGGRRPRFSIPLRPGRRCASHRPSRCPSPCRRRYCKAWRCVWEEERPQRRLWLRR
jgi:hypothetical protein